VARLETLAIGTHSRVLHFTKWLSAATPTRFFAMATSFSVVCQIIND